VKAWNTVFAQVVASGATAAVFVAGDDERAKETVIGLARELGHEPVDAGPLSAARELEALAGLVVRLAYGQGLGPFALTLQRL
jgi:predicted dinucleotide-binding enzyme